jgi:hypothetical protein
MIAWMLLACSKGGGDSSPVDTDVAGCDTDTCDTTDPAIPAFEHVFVIVMENTSSQTLLDSDNTPFIHQLIADGAYAQDYHGVEHPSLPNYLAMVSGVIEDNGPKDCDCEPEGEECDSLSCTFLTHDCGCPQTAEHLGDQLEAAGRTWKAYAEDIGTPCNLVGDGTYEPKHVPFVYYPSLTDDATRCAEHVVDFDELATDLAGDTPDFAFITPNLDNDMHDPVLAGDTNRANGEAWLSAVVPDILASSAYTDHGMLVILWDEDDLSGILRPDDPIPFILLSPLANQGGYESTVTANHFSFLATLEDGFGVPRLGAAATADPMADFFP